MGKKISAVLSTLLLIGIALEGVFLSNGMKKTPTVAEASPATGESYLHEAYSEEQAPMMTTLKDYDSGWRATSIRNIEAWLDSLKLPDEETDTTTSEFDEKREQLTAMQKVVLVIQQYYTDLGIVEDAEEGELGYMSELDQWRGLAEALFDAGVLGIEETELVVVEKGTERFMTSDERAAYILQIAEAQGFITFKLSNFWKAVEIERAAIEAEQKKEDALSPPQDESEEDKHDYDSQPDVGKNYHGQFKATFVCTCSSCWVSGKYDGIKQGSNVVWVDPNYIDVGATISLDSVLAVTFKTVHSNGAVKGREIVVFYSNHAMASATGTSYPRVFYE